MGNGLNFFSVYLSFWEKVELSCTEDLHVVNPFERFAMFSSNLKTDYRRRG